MWMYSMPVYCLVYVSAVLSGCGVMGHGSRSHEESWLVLSGARRGRITKASLTVVFTAETNKT